MRETCLILSIAPLPSLATTHCQSGLFLTQEPPSQTFSMLKVKTTSASTGAMSPAASRRTPSDSPTNAGSAGGSQQRNSGLADLLLVARHSMQLAPVDEAAVEKRNLGGWQASSEDAVNSFAGYAS